MLYKNNASSATLDTILLMKAGIIYVNNSVGLTRTVIFAASMSSKKMKTLCSQKYSSYLMLNLEA